MKCIVRVLTFFAAYVVIGVVSVVVLIGIAVLGAVISQYWQDILLVIVGLLSVASFYAFWIIAVRGRGSVFVTRTSEITGFRTRSG